MIELLIPTLEGWERIVKFLQEPGWAIDDAAASLLDFFSGRAEPARAAQRRGRRALTLEKLDSPETEDITRTSGFICAVLYERRLISY